MGKSRVTRRERCGTIWIWPRASLGKRAVVNEATDVFPVQELSPKVSATWRELWIKFCQNLQLSVFHSLSVTMRDVDKIGTLHEMEDKR